MLYIISMATIEDKVLYMANNEGKDFFGDEGEFFYLEDYMKRIEQTKKVVLDNLYSATKAILSNINNYLRPIRGMPIKKIMDDLRYRVGPNYRTNLTSDYAAYKYILEYSISLNSALTPYSLSHQSKFPNQ